MTLDEYKRIGEKYELEYDDYAECFFSKGHRGDYRFVVSSFKGAPTGGIAWVYCEFVYSESSKTIYSDYTHCSSLNAKGFEEQIKLYFRNYKKALIKVKTMELEKDFKND